MCLTDLSVSERMIVVQVRVFKPDGRDSFDMTAYRDAAGNGFLVRSVENRFLGISALTEGYHDTAGICSLADRVSSAQSHWHTQLWGVDGIRSNLPGLQQSIPRSKADSTLLLQC